jgi:hypothetical protein
MKKLPVIPNRPQRKPMTQIALLAVEFFLIGLQLICLGLTVSLLLDLNYPPEDSSRNSQN